MGFGRYLTGFIGAIVRWIYGTVWRTVANKPKYKFSEYLYGPEDSEDWFDQKGHRFVNQIIGFIAIVVICWIIIKL